MEHSAQPVVDDRVIADTLIEALDNWEAYYKEKGENIL